MLIGRQAKIVRTFCTTSSEKRFGRIKMLQFLATLPSTGFLSRMVQNLPQVLWGLKGSGRGVCKTIVSFRSELRWLLSWNWSCVTLGKRIIISYFSNIVQVLSLYRIISNFVVLVLCNLIANVFCLWTFFQEGRSRFYDPIGLMLFSSIYWAHSDSIWTTCTKCFLFLGNSQASTSNLMVHSLDFNETGIIQVLCNNKFKWQHFLEEFLIKIRKEGPFFKFASLTLRDFSCEP